MAVAVGFIKIFGTKDNCSAAHMTKQNVLFRLKVDGSDGFSILLPGFYIWFGSKVIFM